MDRRKFFQLSTATATLGATAATTNAADPGIGLTQGHPSAMAPRPNGMDIIWRVSGLSKGYVEYGTTKTLDQIQRNDGWGLRPAGTELIRVSLRGLNPGTEYFYRTVTENFDHKNPRSEPGEIRSFKTLDPAADKTTFTVWNDTHKHEDTIEKLASITKKSDFLLWNGDISNDWNREGEVAQSILTPTKTIDLTTGNPLLILRGNHDLRGSLAYQVEDTVATPSGKPWFAVRSGPVAAICLDTGEDKPDDHEYLFGRVACEPMRREQAAWLKHIIEQPEIKNAPYRIVFCHIPLRWIDEATQHSYDHFSKRSRDQWHDSLVKWGAQIVVSGHTHRDAYIPTNPNFPYAQLVGGGPKPDQARLITGTADNQSLVLKMQDLAGKETRKHTFPALA